MYRFNWYQSSFYHVLTHIIIALLAIFFLVANPMSAAQAQSYEQRQKILRFQKSQRLQAQKRARYQRYQQQRRAQKTNGGLFGALFAPKKTRPAARRRVRRPDVYVPPVNQPILRKNKKSVVLGSYNNTKTKKIKKSKTQKAISRTAKTGKRRAGRAMCVRLCDGFYWPVNRIGLSAKKIKDKNICQNSCSATTRVYYAGYGGDAGQSMRDYRGNLYKNLKNAFSYRKKMNPVCRCRPEPWTKAAQRMYDKRSQNAEKLSLTDLTDKKTTAKRTVKFRTSMAD